MLCIHLAEKLLHEFRDVIFVLTQRRHVDVEHVKTIVEIIAKLTVRHGLFRYFVRGGKNSHVNGGFHLAAQAT